MNEAFDGKYDFIFGFCAENCCNWSSHASWRFMRVDSSNIHEICKQMVIFHDIIWNFPFARPYYLRLRINLQKMMFVYLWFMMIVYGCRFSRESSMGLCNIGQSCLCPGSLCLVFGPHELAAYAPHEHVEQQESLWQSQIEFAMAVLGTAFLCIFTILSISVAFLGSCYI